MSLFLTDHYIHHFFFSCFITVLLYEAGRRVRTDDLLITNQILFRLSYAGIFGFKSK